MRKEKKFFSKKNLVSLFIVFIMISSILGYFGSTSQEKVKYGDHSFISKGGRWVSRINDAEVGFDYLPLSVEDISVSSNILERLSNTLEVDISYDFNDSYVESIALASYQLDQALGSQGIYVRIGLTNQSEYGLPVILCEDATPKVPVIYLRKSNRTDIFLEGDCILAEARSSEDIIRIKDRLLYGILGVID